MGFGVCLVCVALRKESVDRNDNGNAVAVSDLVALRKESVDRNPSAIKLLAKQEESLSARRAWIEISVPSLSSLTVLSSLSARRAWIEI